MNCGLRVDGQIASPNNDAIDSVQKNTLIQVGRLHAAQGNSEVAVAALRQAVTLQPGKAAFWSILGVELAKAGTWAQAQHCLVRSLQLETSATAWTNLGAVYMSLGEHTLANKAFKEAQAAQPDYVRGWAGQVSPIGFLLRKFLQYHSGLAC